MYTHPNSTTFASQGEHHVACQLLDNHEDCLPQNSTSQLNWQSQHFNQHLFRTCQSLTITVITWGMLTTGPCDKPEHGMSRCTCLALLVSAGSWKEHAMLMPGQWLAWLHVAINILQSPWHSLPCCNCNPRTCTQRMVEPPMLITMCNNLPICPAPNQPMWIVSTAEWRKQLELQASAGCKNLFALHVQQNLGQHHRPKQQHFPTIAQHKLGRQLCIHLTVLA